MVVDHMLLTAFHAFEVPGNSLDFDMEFLFKEISATYIIQKLDKSTKLNDLVILRQKYRRTEECYEADRS